MTDTSSRLPPETDPDTTTHTWLTQSLPLRFVWQSDDLGRISGISQDLNTILGPDHALDGRTWDEVLALPGTDPNGGLSQALTRRDTWSGLTIFWPLAERRILKLELAGLPLFDRDHNFCGFRGFGIVREPPSAPAPLPDENDPAPAPSFERAEPMPEETPVLLESSPQIVPLRRNVRPALNPEEDLAFREIARALTTRTDRQEAPPSEPPLPGLLASAADSALSVLETLPTALLVHRHGVPLFTNHALLDLLGFDDLNALTLQGLDSLFDEMPPSIAGETRLAIRTSSGRLVGASVHLKTIRWQDMPASLMLISPATEATADIDLSAALDAATDGVITFDENGRLLSVNQGARRLFEYDQAELQGRTFTALFAADSHRAALEYFEKIRLRMASVGTIAGREVVGLSRSGRSIPLIMTIANVSKTDETRFCAVFRDVSQERRIEDELRAAKTKAEQASAQKTDFLARVNHEIRTPLNAIIGFAEIMMEERYGPLGSERYAHYVQDIHSSGTLITSLVNDLLDLAKIEAGRLDLDFVSTSLNEAVSVAVSMLQPEANKNRIIIRTGLSPHLPPVIADARSLKQIALNLVSNAVKYTPPGGQIVVTTLLTDAGHALLRIRDTGPGMNNEEVALAMQPFRQLSPANISGGTGLGLPLTKALIEANRARFTIQSAPGAGTLAEVDFPANRVMGG